MATAYRDRFVAQRYTAVLAEAVMEGMGGYGYDMPQATLTNIPV